ncbi:MAG: glycosyltransferase, partial [Muribaculaceae bacterium]|nr:glycosyltransferase [Muribaculaceae bacterium]
MKVSLIISTYNRPDALSVTLESVRNQSRLPDEVIIGDDGSGADTARVINRFKDGFPVPIIHVWQEDKGFRLAMIRNRSVAAASGDYIIQTDGDVLLHPHFIR